MNLALLIENLEVGGSEGVVQRLALGLARRGHRVHLYCLRSAEIPVDHLRAGGVIVREMRATRRSSAGTADPRGGRPARQLLLQLARGLRRDRIDLVHAHCCAAVVWAFPVTRLLGIPLVHVWHGWAPGPPTRQRRLAVQLARYMNGVGVNSESLRKHLSNIGPLRRAESLPNGIDGPPVGPREARRRLAELCGDSLAGPVILSVGNIRVEKDQGTLLRAFAALRRHWPDARLVGVGLWQDRAYWVQVQRWRRELGLEGVALFPGPAAEAWRLLAGADVFCLSSSRESMPNVVLEAMSQRVPIVATTVGDVGRRSLDHPSGRRPGRPTRGAGVPPANFWMLHHLDTALLVPPGQPRELAAALARTLRDPTAARRRADRAYEDYRRYFTTDQMVQRYEGFYEESLRSPPRRTALRKPAVVMVGPPAESMGGMATSIGRLMSSPLRENYTLHRFATTSPPVLGRRPGRPTRGAGVPPANYRPEADAPRSLFRVPCSLNRHLRTAGRLVATLVRHRIDIVHIHTCSFFTFYRNLVDLALARLLGQRVILHIRGGHFERFCAAARGPARWLIRRGLAAADAVIVLSPQWRRRLAPYTGRTPVFVVPNGVEVDGSARAPVADRQGPCRFLYLAALTEAKGLADLVDAAQQLQTDGVDFELVVAGPATEEPQTVWAGRVRAAGLADRVRFVGPVQGEAKAQLLASADCFVHPSHCEAMPNVILEAAAAGLPIIATAVGSVPELVQADRPEGPRTPLVPAHDPAALARAMRQLASDPRQRQLVGEALRQHVASDYSLTATARQIAAVYEHVRREPSAPGAFEAHFVHRITYRVHEGLRGRPTRREYDRLCTLPALSSAEIDRDVRQRLGDLLRFAAAKLPYYAELFRRCGVVPEADDPAAELRKLPVIDKRTVRDHADRMTWKEVPGGLHPASSGGTTGDTLYFHVDHVRQAQDLAARLFMQGLFGVRPGERRVHLWGSPIETRGGTLRRWRDRLLNEVVLDAFDLSPSHLDAHLDRLRRFRPAVLYGYTTAVTLLARHSGRRHRPAHFGWLRLVVLTGEEILPEQVAQVRSAFGCAVAAEYGNREVGLIAHECPRGRLHTMAPHIHVEIVDNGQPVTTGQCGEVVCTTLNTRAQPFLRYRVGDLGRLTGEACPCGLPLPVMRVEGGKVAGFLALPDGRLCHGAVSSHAVKGLPGIVAFRTHQRQVDRIEVLLVVNDDFQPEAMEQIRQRYQALFGSRIHVNCRVVDELPPDPSGKRRHVISDVAPHSAHIELADLPR